MKTLALLAALATTTLANPHDAGQAAVDFLTKIRDGSVNLEPDTDTALTPATTKAKRDEIQRLLTRTAADTLTGSLTAGSSKIEGPLAAVIVHQVAGFNPDRVRAFAVALVQRNNRWLPAPVLASFENAGIGYDPTTRASAKSLENWMLDQASADLEKLQQESTARMRAQITATTQPDELAKLSATDALNRFVNACATRNLPLVLAFLGGLSDPLPDDWNNRLLAAETALAHPTNPTNPWRPLVASDLIRTTTQEESPDNEASLILTTIDPLALARTPAPTPRKPLQQIPISVARNASGSWSATLPADLLTPSRPAGDDADEDGEPAAAENRTRQPFKRITPDLRRDHPLEVHPSAEEALAAFHKALLEPTPAKLIRLLDLAGDSSTDLAGCTAAAKIWGLLHDPTEIRIPIPLESKINAAEDPPSSAAATFLIYSAQTGTPSIHHAYLKRSTNGWHLLKGFAPTSADSTPFLWATEWTKKTAERWKNNWQGKILETSTLLPTFQPASTPSEEEARQTVGSWLEAIRDSNLAKALPLIAFIDSDKSRVRVLSNLRHEINSSRKSKSPAQTIAVNRGKTCTTVTVQTDASGKPTFPIYPVVNTANGPRILLEVDLFADTTRTRKFLNDTSLTHLKDLDARETAAELAELLEKATK